MSRFIGRIPVDPKGYRWGRDGGYGPEDGYDSYVCSTYIHWNSRDELLEMCEENEVIPFDHFYDPFVSEPALFRIFADLKPTEEETLAFANRYGDFSSLEDCINDVEWTLWHWEDMIERVSGFVKKADDFIAHQQRAKSGGKKLTTETIDLLNELFAHAEVHLSAVALNGGIDLKIDVYALPYVFYLQIAESIADLKQYRNCEFCNKPFEVSPQVNRSDRLFCSDNCRVKAYQRRKKKVIDLRKSGKSLSEIAKSTNTQFANVKHWTKDIQKGAR